MNTENAGRLLSIAEQRRQHLANIINALNVLFITLIFGIAAFFLKGFLDHSSMVNQPAGTDGAQPFAFSYIVLAAGLSSIILAFWRWYVRYLDDNIAELYPEIMLYESILGIPNDAGIAKHLTRQKTIRSVMPTLFQEQRRQLVKQLVEDRRIGRRGYTPFDIIVWCIIGGCVAIAITDLYSLHTSGLLCKLIDYNEIRSLPILASKWIGYVLIVAGLGFQAFSFYRYQRNPSEPYVNKTVEKLKISHWNLLYIIGIA
ncbi:hypothetical protein ES703_99057 [subsurface metagenome]